MEDLLNKIQLLEQENSKLIFELEKYLEYVQKQESQLSEIEKQKNILSNTFFTPF